MAKRKNGAPTVQLEPPREFAGGYGIFTLRSTAAQSTTAGDQPILSPLPNFASSVRWFSSQNPIRRQSRNRVSWVSAFQRPRSQYPAGKS